MREICYCATELYAWRPNTSRQEEGCVVDISPPRRRRKEIVAVSTRSQHDSAHRRNHSRGKQAAEEAVIASGIKLSAATSYAEDSIRQTRAVCRATNEALMADEEDINWHDDSDNKEDGNDNNEQVQVVTLGFRICMLIMYELLRVL